MKGRFLGIITLPVVALLVIAIDQATKAWIMSTMSPGESRPIIEGVVQLRYVENSGAAFGFFQGWAGALSVAAIAIVIAIVLSASRMSNSNFVLMLAMGLVVGGAVGNLIDRLRLGYVTDFVEVTAARADINHSIYTFPVFNAADSAITVGVILILLTILFGKHEPEPVAANEKPARYYERQDNSAWRVRTAGAEASPAIVLATDESSIASRQPTPAGWAGLLVVIAGFLFMAVRSAAKEQ